MSNFYGSICLSDIPKRLIEDGKNGKKYLRIEVREMKQAGQYGDTHFIVASCKKESNRWRETIHRQPKAIKV